MAQALKKLSTTGAYPPQTASACEMSATVLVNTVKMSAHYMASGAATKDETRAQKSVMFQ